MRRRGCVDIVSGGGVDRVVECRWSGDRGSGRCVVAGWIGQRRQAMLLEEEEGGRVGRCGMLDVGVLDSEHSLLVIPVK